MTVPGRTLINRRYATFACLALFIIWTWVALDRPYSFPDHVPWDISSATPLSSPSPVEDLFDFPPIESAAIQSVCADVQWNSSVVFTCNGPVGGIGNIRNSILNCVRYAISAGAGLVIPRIVKRASDDIYLIRTGITTDMSYMFETQHFVDSLKLSCPSLRIFASLDDIKGYNESHRSISLLPESLVQNIPGTGLPRPERWRGLFHDWLQENATFITTRPFIVDLERSYLQYPIYSDGEGFALSFGGILKLRSDARKLATKTLQLLNERSSLKHDLTLPIIPKFFFGAHLRTERDARIAWPTEYWKYAAYDMQASSYLTQATRSNSSVIYLACGDKDEAARFSADAATTINITVLTKSDLLTGSDLEQLNSWAWDQQALVDFLVMSKASDFAGVSHSSFAWNVALKRHMFSKTKRHLDGPQMLSDELSQVYGPVRAYPEYAACLWP